ncbi:hypothetical protein [Savagea faecisuis]|uniref:Uncharacterized protein n=1 Tax=Savagea faecisuis TaxID=1274803 RepID=A0ABW3GW29_9BACL
MKKPMIRILVSLLILALLAILVITYSLFSNNSEKNNTDFTPSEDFSESSLSSQSIPGSQELEDYLNKVYKAQVLALDAIKGIVYHSNLAKEDKSFLYKKDWNEGMEMHLENFRTSGVRLGRFSIESDDPDINDYINQMYDYGENILRSSEKIKTGMKMNSYSMIKGGIDDFFDYQDTYKESNDTLSILVARYGS